MSLKKEPILRKQIFPWYDSNTMCWLILFLMITILGFGITGFMVSLEFAEYSDFYWVPGLIIILSSYVILSLGVRLINRYMK